ncbi:MAG: winged helix-turn-helix domain-containing protein [Promethearchaeota archaeon]
MNNLEDYFSKIDEKFEGLNARITALQDLVLYMKNEFELLSKSKIENQGIAELTELTETNINLFIDDRPKSCSLLDPCTTLIEKSIFKVLNEYVKKGSNSANKLLGSYYTAVAKYKENGRCPDNKCIDNALKLFDSVKKLIESNIEKNLTYSRKIFSKINEIKTKEEIEKVECKLISPLSSELRLKILKILSKGSTNYAQLERELGLKGGHFYFHLDKLIDAGYVKQEEEKGSYYITMNGIKALKFLYELSQEFATPY